MRIVVPVKQVPQAAALRFDEARGRAVRDGVPLVLNAYDRRALGEALRLRGELGGSVTVVTLGPAQARDAVEECLRLGADRAMHLCDPAFAGSDTLGTARTLAAAIHRLGADLVLCGQRSVDAETGVVGPMLAALLGLPFATAVVHVRAQADRSLDVESLTDLGTTSSRLPLPCLLTAAERLHRPEASVPGSVPAPDTDPGTDSARTGPAIQTWTAADLGLLADQVGSAGALTRVRRIATVERRRRCEIVDGASDAVVERLAEELLAALSRTASAARSSRRAALLPPLSAAGMSRPGPAHPDGRAASLDVLIVPDPLRPWAAPRLAALADRIGGCPRLLPDGPTASDVERAVRENDPALVLATDAAVGRDALATVAARLRLGLVTGVESMHIDTDGQVVFSRPAWGGGVLADVEVLTVPALATVRPEALAAVALADDGNRAPEHLDDESIQSEQARDERKEIESIDVEHVDLERSHTCPWQGTPEHEHGRPEGYFQASDIETAGVVIGIGTGVGGVEGLALVERLGLVKRLAGVLGAAVGGTRKVVDRGWLPPQRQIGLSGRQVAPRVYLALGTRGSFNHAIGIRRAATILAVNADPRAEIFAECDLGVVADWQVVVAALVDRLGAHRRA